MVTNYLWRALWLEVEVEELKNYTAMRGKETCKRKKCGHSYKYHEYTQFKREEVREEHPVARFEFRQRKRSSMSALDLHKERAEEYTTPQESRDGVFEIV
jgi:hypothetical protein